jgi:hypothetical protein
MPPWYLIFFAFHEKIVETVRRFAMEYDSLSEGYGSDESSCGEQTVVAIAGHRKFNVAMSMSTSTSVSMSTSTSPAYISMNMNMNICLCTCMYIYM